MLFNVNRTDNKGETVLFYAVSNNNENKVPQLIDAGANVNIINNEGKTALFYAVQQWNNESLVRALIAAGADVNITDNKGKTALFYAVQQRCNESVVRALIDAGADVNITDNEGKTAFFYAVQQSDNERVVRELIAAGADVNIIDNEGKTALFYAVQQRYNEMVRELIDAGADVNITDNEGKTALLYAVQQRYNESMVRALIDAGADVNITDNEGKAALFYADSYYVFAKLLVEHGKAEVNARDVYGRSTLFYAMAGSLKTACLLMDKGANPEMKDNGNVSVLFFFAEVCLRRGIDISKGLKLLKKKGVSRNTIFMTVISVVFCSTLRRGEAHLKSVFDALEVAKSFLRIYDPKYLAIRNILKVQRETKNKEYSFENVSSNILAPLVKLGADPRSADSQGNTALHYAARLALHEVAATTVIDICLQLKKFGVSFHARNNRKETPVLFALSKEFLYSIEINNNNCFEELVKVFRFLVENGLSLDDVDIDENSVFHLILILFQRVLGFQGERETRSDVLHQVARLFQFCCQTVKAKLTTFNKRDVHLNTLTHLWARLQWFEYSQEKEDQTWKTEDWGILKALLEELLQNGTKLNDTNENDETPLHVCTTWRAVELLIDKGANPRVLDSSRRTPLLSAALRFKDSIEGGNTSFGFFYEYSSENTEYPFWKFALQKNLDPWTADKNSESVLSVLIQSEAFTLAQSFLEAARDTNLLESDENTASLLTVICKDKSKRTLWKSNLVEIILKSRKDHSKPLQCNGETPLHSCCRNIINLYSCDDSSRAERTSTSVHWIIAKQLLLYGTDYTIPDDKGQSCLDIAKTCPPLEDLLKSPVDITEAPLLIPWTSVSKRHKAMLAKVSRGQECKNVQQYWCHRSHLANGSFGFVFAGINGKDGREVAIKRIEKLRLQRPEDKREITNLTALANCEQIVLYLSFLEDKSFCYVVLELMEGNLDEYLDSTFDAKNNVKLSQDIVKGLDFLHYKEILHRDLKPTNILYKLDPELCLKIADFGLSRRVDSNSTTVYGTNAGTRSWIAPEVFNSTKDHSKASDVFACGLVLHYLLSVKKHPFAPADSAMISTFDIINETESNVKNGKMEGWDDSLCPEAAHLVKAMLNSNDNMRPSADKVLDHPFFWTRKKKLDLLTAVGNQAEIACPRAKRTLPLTAVENDLEASFGTIVKYVDWNDPGYVHMPAIYTEMTTKRKSYDTPSVVELVRFIRNAYAHVTELSQPDLLLEDFVFLEYFPNLVMEVYKAVTTHGWDQTREEIKYAMNK